MPAGYGADLVVLQTRDPRWIHAYWELAPSTVAQGREKLGADEGASAELVLRLHPEETSRWSDVRLTPGSQDWYLEVEPDGAWFVEIGLKGSRGTFLPLIRSNSVRTPPDRPSDRIDEEWGVLRGIDPALEPTPYSMPKPA